MRSNATLVMAVYPNARGFAYVVLESPLLVVDWGATDVAARRKIKVGLSRVSLLVDRYRPDVLVLRASEARGSRHDDFLKVMRRLAKARRTSVITISRKNVRAAFSEAEPPTRYRIAESVADLLPALRPLLPPQRKIWIGENRRMGLFDAAALALASVRLKGEV